jgi:hypothetical protein
VLGAAFVGVILWAVYTPPPRQEATTSPKPNSRAEVERLADELEKMAVERRRLEQARRDLEQQRLAVANGIKEAEKQKREQEQERALRDRERALAEQTAQLAAQLEEKQRKRQHEEAEREVQLALEARKEKLSKQALQRISEYELASSGDDRLAVYNAVRIVKLIHTLYVLGKLTKEKMYGIKSGFPPSAWREARVIIRIGGDYIPPTTNVTLEEAWNSALTDY